MNKQWDFLTGGRTEALLPGARNDCDKKCL
jgi:hypothetical protein